MSRFFHREGAGEVYRHVQLLREKAKAQSQLRAYKLERHNLRRETSRVNKFKTDLFHDGKRARALYRGIKKTYGLLSKK
jgi:hypothetical protein